MDRAVVAVPPGSQDELQALTSLEGLELELVEGGASRAESVANALARADAEIAVVHDAARPLVTAELIDGLVERLLSDEEAAGVIAATPVTDTVKRVTRGKRQIGRTERRDELWAAQTPQVFRAAALRDVLGEGPAAAATDEAMLVEREGWTVLLHETGAPNLKVTTPADLELAELILRSR